MNSNLEQGKAGPLALMAINESPYKRTPFRFKRILRQCPSAGNSTGKSVVHMLRKQKAALMQDMLTSVLNQDSLQNGENTTILIKEDDHQSSQVDAFGSQ